MKYQCKYCNEEFNTPDIGIRGGVCPYCGSPRYVELPKTKKLTLRQIVTVLELLVELQKITDEDLEELADLLQKRM